MVSPPRLLILYGTETGNAEDLAIRFARESKRRGVRVVAKTCDDYQLDQLPEENLVLFICSTTGNGDEPANMKTFWLNMRRKDYFKTPRPLEKVKMAVIGLGDSSYALYNVVAKKLYRRLEQLGGQLFLELGLGDEQHELGMDGTIVPWIVKFWSELELIYPMDKTQLLTPDDILPPIYRLTVADESATKEIVRNGVPEEFDQSANYDQRNPCQVRLVSNKRVTADEHFQDVRLFTFELSSERQQKALYEPGDVLMVVPENLEENVQDFISLLNLSPDTFYTVTRNDPDWMSSSLDFITAPISAYDLVKKYLDIQSIPRRSFFDLFWRFSRDDIERTKLKEFTTGEGQEDLYEYVNRPKRNILEVLKDFPHTTSSVPLDYLLDLIPVIRPRAFSIASSPTVNPNRIEILVAVVDYKTRLKANRLGLCSNWLARLSAEEGGCLVPVWFRKGTFRIPKNKSTFLMVGPGTGVAVFRSLIQDRANRHISSNVLFFGCRNESGDFYLADEWKSLSSSKHLDFFVAFSRDEPDRKVYVQDQMWLQKELIYSLFSQPEHNLHIFIAGNSKQMPQQVRDMIIKILESMDNELAGHGADIVTRLEANKRIQYECWS